MLTDTLFRQPRQFGVQLLQKRGDAASRELSTRRLRLDAGTSATFHLADEETVVILQQGRGTFAAGGNNWPVSRSGVFTERATALYLPPGVELTATAETVARSDPDLDASASRWRGGAHRPRRRQGQRPRPRQLLARGPRHLRHRSARQAPHGRRDLQPAGQLEQLSAAQARRQGRRADARRGLLLHASTRRRASVSRFSTRTMASRPATRSATAMRCSCPTATIRCRRRRDIACATSGAWPASSASSRCTKTRRTSGSTRRSC